MIKLLKQFLALCNLALAFICHIGFKRWFSRKGLDAFLSFYKEDRIFALKKEVRDQFGSYSNCVFCGLCVTQCEVTNPLFYQKFVTPAAIVFSYTRSLPEISYNQDFISQCSSSQAAENICPQNMPLNDVIQFVKSYV